MKFKRIYIEITNICNLKCSFCSNSKRNKKEMSIDEFKLVMSKITMYTDYIYLHVKGETLSHHYLDDILSICKKYNKLDCKSWHNSTWSSQTWKKLCTDLAVFKVL